MLLPRTFVTVLASNSRCLVRNPNLKFISRSNFLPIAVLRSSDVLRGYDDLRVRCLCSTSVLFEKPSSKIEETVQHLKKEEQPEVQEKKVPGTPQETSVVKPVDLTPAEQVSIFISYVFFCISS